MIAAALWYLQEIGPSDPAWRHFTVDATGKYAITALVYGAVIGLAIIASRRFSSISGAYFSQYLLLYIALRSVRQLGGLLLNVEDTTGSVGPEVTALATLLTIAMMVASVPVVRTVMVCFVDREAPRVEAAAVRRAVTLGVALAAAVMLARQAFPSVGLPPNTWLVAACNVVVASHAIWTVFQWRERASIHARTLRMFLIAQVLSLVAEVTRSKVTFNMAPLDTPMAGLAQLLQAEWIFLIAAALLLSFLLVVASFPYEKLKLDQEQLRVTESLRDARSSDARLGQYVIGLSHELRNLMLGVRMLDSALADLATSSTSSTSSTSLTSVTAVRQLNDYLEERIARLASFANPGPSQQAYLDLPLFLQRFRVVMEGILAQHDLVEESRVRSVLVRVPPQVLKDALVEVLTNARDFSPTESTILIRSDRVAVGAGDSPFLRPGDYGAVTISDRGVGMSAEELSVVFDAAFTKRPTRDAGFGLINARGQLRVTGGDLTITSTVGQGTTVTLWVPCAETVSI
ncbi:MAG: ATP-binding protein [Gemmatimonadetes bacterium]|nr:ATP-binding protein [Gemmatimonadota bacterium]